MKSESNSYIPNIPRDFKGIWIPKEIWMDRSLSYFEICLFSEIHSLNGEKGCYASNEYFCSFFNERERKIQEGISKLKQKGYVIQESFDGRTRILRTNINPDKSLFSTAEVRNKENDKSLFNTSGMLESAPLSYIENKEENIVCVASPPVAAQPRCDEIKKMFFDKKEVLLKKSDFYTQCVMKRKDFTASEIEEAWIILVDYQNPLRDAFAFLEGTIINNRKLKKLREIEEKECHLKNKRELKKQDTKAQSENSKELTMEKGTWGLHLADWKSQVMPARKLLPT